MQLSKSAGDKRRLGQHPYLNTYMHDYFGTPYDNPCIFNQSRNIQRNEQCHQHTLAVTPQSQESGANATPI